MAQPSRLLNLHARRVCYGCETQVLRRHHRDVKRSEINRLVLEAREAFANGGWTLPPEPRWDVTDFGLSDWTRFGLVLVNLADEPEYCEKLMYAREGMVTPAHAHRVKKEDIIARSGSLAITLWTDSTKSISGAVEVKLNGVAMSVPSGSTQRLNAGERVTLFPGVFHEFVPIGGPCIIGEVSTANDDVNDNFFVDNQVGRYSVVEEDKPPLVRLIGEP